MTEQSSSAGSGQTGRTLGDYRLDALVGPAGLGEVYRATQLSLGRVVSLKLLGQHVAAEVRAEFLRRSRRIAAISHPNLLPVYAAGETDGHQYVVTRWLDGPDLARLMSAGLAAKSGVRYLAEVAEGLHAAHQAELVHGGLTPSEIHVADGSALLGGFRPPPPPGKLLTQVDESRVAWLAPEQLSGKPATARTDMWAIGVMLHSLLTGRHPFGAPGQPTSAIAQRIFGGAPAMDDLPPWQEAVILACLHSNPAKRPDDAMALHKLLQSLLKGLITGRAPDSIRLSPPDSARVANTTARVANATERVANTTRAEPKEPSPSADAPTVAVAPRLPRPEELGAREPTAAPQPDARASAVSGRELGKFRLIEVLGQGGMGVVYRAEQTDLGRDVALKLLRDPSPDALVRFDREARAVARLRHPNVVAVYEVGELEGRRYLAMDLVDGGSLQEAIEQDRLSIRESLGMLRDVARAVHHAHEQGILHRDIKPANILLDAENRPLVTDFGLAKDLSAEASRLTRSGEVFGTPSYMSPEQAQGAADVGPASDVYSLGAVLYTIITGKPPFSGDSVMAVLMAVIAVEPEWPRSTSIRLHTDIQTICMKALEKSPARRYPTAVALADDLERFLSGEPIEARRPTGLQRARRFLSRHRGIALAMMLAAVGALVAVGLVGHHQRKDRIASLSAKSVTLRGTLAERLGRIEQLRDADARPLVEPSGELARAAVDAWFDAHHDAVDTLDRLAELARAPESPERGELDAIDAQRRELCLLAADKAVELGDVTLARLWVARAASAGMSGQERRARLAQIERKYQEGITARLDRAREVLDQIRRDTEGKGHGKVLTRHYMARLIRLRCPGLVQLLLDRRYLESGNEAQRVLAITTLGQLGDTTTKGPDGQDAVEALCSVLERLDISTESAMAISIASALSDLSDGRASSVISRLRQRVGSSHPFWRYTQRVVQHLPLPAEASTYEGLLDRGRARELKGDVEGAIREFTLAIELDKQRDEAYTDRSRARSKSGDYVGSLNDLKVLINRNPRDARTIHNRGALHVERGQYRKALSDFDTAVRLAPDRGEFLVSRGEARKVLRDLKGALADFTLAISKQDGSWIKAHANRGYLYTELGKYELAHKDFETVLEKVADEQAMIGDGVAYYRQKSYGEAIRQFDRALFHDLRSQKALLWRSAAHARMGDLARSRKDFDRAVSLASKPALVYRWMGRLSIHEGRYDEAIETLTTAVELDPELASAYRWRAEAHGFKRSYELAEQDYTRAIKRAPRIVDQYIQRGGVRLVLRKLDKAIGDFTMALQLWPGDWLALSSRGRVYLEQGKWDKAREDLAQSLRSYTGSWRVWEDYAFALSRLGKRADALRAARKALAIAPASRRPSIEQFIKKLGG